MPKHLFVTEKTPLFLIIHKISLQSGTRLSAVATALKSHERADGGIRNPAGYRRVFSKNSVPESDSGICPGHRYIRKKCILRPYDAVSPDSLVPHFLHRRIPKPSALRQGRGIRAQNARCDAGVSAGRIIPSQGSQSSRCRCNLGAASGQASERIVQPPERLVLADE